MRELESWGLFRFLGVFALYGRRLSCRRVACGQLAGGTVSEIQPVETTLACNGTRDYIMYVH